MMRYELCIIIIVINLKLDQRIDVIVHKAMSLLTFLYATKIIVEPYCTNVHPALEFRSSVQSPHTSFQINRIDKVQRFFTTIVAGLWSVQYDKCLDILELHSLGYR
jgi:hypothetical protein